MSRKAWRVFVRERKKTHKHKQICGIVLGPGWVPKICLCVFFGSFLMWEKHINKIPPKNPGTIPWNFCLSVFSLLDERQITHLICARLKYDLYDFFRRCFGAFYTRERTGSRPKTPLKKSYRSYFRRAQIRWVIWRSSIYVFFRSQFCEFS